MYFKKRTLLRDHFVDSTFILTYVKSAYNGTEYKRQRNTIALRKHFIRSIAQDRLDRKRTHLESNKTIIIPSLNNTEVFLIGVCHITYCTFSNTFTCFTNIPHICFCPYLYKMLHVKFLRQWIMDHWKRWVTQKKWKQQQQYKYMITHSWWENDKVTWQTSLKREKYYKA